MVSEQEVSLLVLAYSACSKLANAIYENMHKSTHFLYPVDPDQGHEMLEFIPAVIVQQLGCILDRSSIHTKTNRAITQAQVLLRSIQNLQHNRTSMTFKCQKKPEKHANTQRLSSQEKKRNECRKLRQCWSNTKTAKESLKYNYFVQYREI